MVNEKKENNSNPPKARPAVFAGRFPGSHRRLLLIGIAALFLLPSLCYLLLYLKVSDAVQLTSPSATPLFEDRNGLFLSEWGGGDDAPLGFWAIEGTMPKRVTECLLVIEDRRFQEHGGVDGRALVRAAINNFSGGPRQGASTVAMQVARMQLQGRRSYWNKLVEMVLARRLVATFGHEAVLRHYLRLMPQGNRIHGVAYASRRYFHKPPADLGWAEAAVLAALPKAPGRMNLYQPAGRERAFKRAHVILDLLKTGGRLESGEHEAAVRQLQGLTIPTREVRPFYGYHAILRMNEVMSFEEEKTFTKPVRTSLDLAVQDRVDAIADSMLEGLRGGGAGNVAAIVAEVGTGRVLAYLGSNFYGDETFAGSINYANVPRSSGSTLKPLIFALGLQTGKFKPCSILADLPFRVSHGSGQYSVTNFDSRYLGPMLYRRALANSRNVPAVTVLREVGLHETYDYLTGLGLVHDERPASDYGLSLAVGGLYVTLEDLVSAYGVLANQGRRFSLKWRMDEGEALDPVQLIPEDVARQITLFLSDPIARLPSFARMGPLEYPFPVAVKTGTSQGYRDGWAVAFSSRYLVGGWIGHPNNDKMKDVTGLSAAEMVKRIMLSLYPDEARRGVHEQPFPPPRGYQAVRVCPFSGGLATADCTNVVLEYFAENERPTEPSDVHRFYAVDRETGRAATPMTPAEKVAVKPFIVLPPIYAAWSARNGYGRPPQAEGAALDARISIWNPTEASTFLIDRDTPRSMQTLPLQASVSPAVPMVEWWINGKPYASVPYPYTCRWPLQEGSHTVQARFPNAAIFSEVVTIRVRQ